MLSKEETSFGSHNSGPQYVIVSASHASRRPPPKPYVGNPMISSAQFPVRIIKSPQESAAPYFCLIGQIRRRDLSVLPLSHQLLIGAKRCSASPAPPRPSAIRYVPAACHAMRIIWGP